MWISPYKTVSNSEPSLIVDLQSHDSFDVIPSNPNQGLCVINATPGQVFFLRIDISGTSTINWFTGITWLTSDGNPPSLTVRHTLCLLRCISFQNEGSGTYEGVILGASD